MKKFLITLILIINCLYSYDSFKPYGFKSTGMGGVGTANAAGAFAAYFNPALLLATPYSAEYAIGVGVTYRENNLAKSLDALSNADITTTLSTAATEASGGSVSTDTRTKLQSIQTALSDLSASNSLYLSVSPYFSSQLTNSFAVSLYTSVDAAISVDVEEGYTEYIFDTGSGYAKYDPTADSVTVSTEADYNASSIEYGINNGKIGITANAMMVAELPITTAGATQLSNGFFAYGANLKLMTMTYVSKSLSLDSGSSAINSLANDSLSTDLSTNVGLDLGIAYQPKGSNTIIGVMGKNLNSPEFKVGSNTYTIDPAYRVGLSQQLFYDMLEVALDYDLTKNESLLIEGEETQNIGVGLEFHPTSWFALRGGYMRDIATTNFNDGTIYTLGLGAGLKWGQLDISYMKSARTGEFDGESIPRYMKINVSFVSKWGGR